MDRRGKSFIKEIIENKMLRRRVTAFILLLSLAVSMWVFWQLRLTGITMTQDQETFCGLEEHVHSEECYTLEGHLHDESCYEEEEILICTIEDEDLEENEYHEHNESCYEVVEKLVCELEEFEDKVLTCELEEHGHSWQCYVDKKAGLEEAWQWEEGFKYLNLTGVWSEDLLAVAETQLGYRESDRNYVLDEEENLTRGYTRYGQWYGDAYADWDSIFVAFSMNYAKIPTNYMPWEAEAYRLLERLNEKELYFDAKGDYVVELGDLVFLEEEVRNNEKEISVALIYKIDKEAGLYTLIKGNHENRVAKLELRMDDKDILGFGSLAQAYENYLEDYKVVEEEQEETERIIGQALLDIDFLDDNQVLLNVSSLEEGDYELVWEYKLHQEFEDLKDDKEQVDEEVLAGEEANEKTDEIGWIKHSSSSDYELLLASEEVEDFLGVSFRVKVFEGEELDSITNEVLIEVEEEEEYVLEATTESGVKVTLSGPASSFSYTKEEMELYVEEILAEKDERFASSLELLEKNWHEKVDEEVEEDKKEGNLQNQQRIFDIILLVDGEEIEPIGPIKVSFIGVLGEKEFEEAGDIQVYHLDKENDKVTDKPTEKTEDGRVIFDTDHLSEYAVTFNLRSQPVPAGVPPNLIETVDNRELGITLDLFDYWFRTSGTTDAAGDLINQGKNIKFRYSSSGMNSHFNGYTANPTQNILQRNLVGGYPMTVSNSGLAAQSVDYLFNREAHPGKAVYPDVTHLLRVDSDGYYVYDSDFNYAYFPPLNVNPEKRFYVGSTYNGRDSKPVGFFPFDSYNPTYRTHQGNQRERFNHFFGLTMEADFILPLNKQVNNKDMIFNFSGDDDAWVYIDDVLVLDIGGVHDPREGSINFKTGQVYVQGVGFTTIADQFAAAGKTWDDSDYSEHTIKFYYMERGANLSNLRLTMNVEFVSRKDLELTKKIVDVNDELTGETFDFQLYLQQGLSDVFEVYKGTANYKDSGEPVTFDTDGTFTLGADQTIVFPGIMDIKKYYLKEVNIDPDKTALVTFNGEALGLQDGGDGGYLATSPEELVHDKFEVYFENYTPASLVDIEVIKTWPSGDENHPASVQFELLDESGNRVSYGGEEVFELNSNNQWTYIFENLLSQNYYVREINIPEGYSPSYQRTVEEGKIIWEIKNRLDSGPRTIIVEKVWLDTSGEIMEEAPEEQVEVELWWRKYIGSSNDRTVTFRIRDNDSSESGSPSYTSIITKKIPNGGSIEFATAFYDNYKPNHIGVGSENTALNSTGRTVVRPYLQWGDTILLDVYELTSVTSDVVVTISYDYNPQDNLGSSFAPDFIVNNSIWYDKVTGPGGSQDQEQIVEEKVPGAPVLTLNEANNWRDLWTNLASSSGNESYEYFVKEITIGANKTPAENLYYDISYSNNDGINSGTITVINKSQLDFGYELPATGGTGTLVYVISGLLLISVSLLYGYKKRSSEGRLNH